MLSPRQNVGSYFHADIVPRKAAFLSFSALFVNITRGSLVCRLQRQVRLSMYAMARWFIETYFVSWTAHCRFLSTTKLNFPGFDMHRCFKSLRPTLRISLVKV